jgi:putative membrane-bound dehydrogenase-like protein
MKQSNRLRQFRQLASIAMIALALATTPVVAQDGVDDSLERDYTAELPRIPVLSPEESLKTFEVYPGFSVDQVAAEPLVADPIALAFDEQGRMFVVEMRGYSEQYDEDRGLISRLEDTDGDGHFDKRSVYVDGLAWPTAVTCYDGGVFVGVPPEILYCKDTTGDGVADVREVVYTGFSLKNVQGLMNTLKWGLDNRIYGATSTSGAEVKPGDDPAALALNLRGRDFKIEPKSRKLIPISGGGQHGMSFDQWGRRFVSSNSDHIQQIMFDDHYLARNPYLAAPGARRSIASDGAAATVYRSSPVEPWRIVRTRLRAKKIVPGIVEGGGTPAGYFTGATGVTIYRGNAWPEEFYGNAFIGDVGSNLMHRKTIDESNIQLVANRAREDNEFLRSSNIWFRPSQFANAPDGTLYVLDMYREVIEHPLSLPPLIKKHLDLTSGRDRGRIYRVIPDGFKQPAMPQLHKASTAELVATLDHDNGWHRETAARLVYEQQDKKAVPALRKLVVEGNRPEGRIRALYALDGLGALRADDVVPGLKDESPKVREHALRLSESFLAKDAALLDATLALQSDTTPQVQYQLAFSLGAATGEKRNEALAELLTAHMDDPWIQLAAKSSLYIGADDALRHVLADADFRKAKNAVALVQELAKYAGASGSKESLGVAVAKLDTLTGEDAKLAQAAVRGVIEGMQLGGQGTLAPEVLAESDLAQGLMRDMIASARKTAENSAAKAEQRMTAIKNLSFAPAAESIPLLSEILAAQAPSNVQIAAIKTLGGYSNAESLAALIANFSAFSPTVRAQAVETMFSRKDWTALALDAIEARSFSARMLDSNRIHFLLNHPDSAIKAKANALLGTHTPTARDEVVERYRPALTLTGNVEKGQALFVEQCNKCHLLEGKGFAVGPDLAAIGNRGAEAILLNIIDPNREINPAYVNYIVETTDWETYSGIISSETATSLTLQRASGEADTILRVNIESAESAELSLMPEGLEEAIDPQAMADLIAYLVSLSS